MAHALDFIPQVSRRAVAPHAQMRQSHRLLFGLPVCDFTWEQALEHARALIGLRGQLSVLSFVDPYKARRARADARYADLLARHVLLPTGGSLDMAARVLTGVPFAAGLPAAAFVPALLTFAAEPLRIAVIGEAGRERDALAARLGAHAPWHVYSAVSMETASQSRGPFPGEPAFDLLILAGDGEEEVVAVDRLLGPEHASLAILAGPMASFVDTGAGSVSSETAFSLGLPVDICLEWMRNRRKN